LLTIAGSSESSPLIRSGARLEVFEAANGSEAFQVLVTKRPQLVILDALMPVMSGFEVMEKLRDAAPTITRDLRRHCGLQEPPLGGGGEEPLQRCRVH